MRGRRESPRSVNLGEDMAISQALDQAQRGSRASASHTSEVSEVAGTLAKAKAEQPQPLSETEVPASANTDQPRLLSESPDSNPFWSPKAQEEMLLCRARPKGLDEEARRIEGHLDGRSSPQDSEDRARFRKETKTDESK